MIYPIFQYYTLVQGRCQNNFKKFVIHNLFYDYVIIRNNVGEKNLVKVKILLQIGPESKGGLHQGGTFSLHFCRNWTISQIKKKCCNYPTLFCLPPSLNKSYLITRYGPGRQSRQQSLHKLGQLQQSITGWEGKDIVANCSEIVFEGKLKVSLTTFPSLFSSSCLFVYDLTGYSVKELLVSFFSDFPLFIFL